MKKRSLLIICSLILVVTVAVSGTLAYLTDRESVANVFTIGRVNITLDEADVDENGVVILNNAGDPVARVKNNKYKLLPGKTYIKDPTVTVRAGSVDVYVRMKVSINCMAELDTLLAPNGADLLSIFNGHDPETWSLAGQGRNEETNTVTYEFRYKEPVSVGNKDVVLDALFDSFTLSGQITVPELDTLEGLTITVYGHAIQSATFADAAAAWAAFDQQVTAPVNP